MIENCHFQDLPVARENQLYLDYLSGQETARKFFSHAPLDFISALSARETVPYPRQQVAASLREYNTTLGAHSAALANINALQEEQTLCVITGQQAGFLGGPAYTAFKIMTAIRLAAQLETDLGQRCVPVFWLASEDHDFDEINHAYFPKQDGEIGRVRFNWSGKGRSIADLQVTPQIERAYHDFFAQIAPGPYWEQAKTLFRLNQGERFSSGLARVWSELFSKHGLIILEPHIVRRAAGDLMGLALERAPEIHHRLHAVSQDLVALGYTPMLDPEQNGGLFTFDEQGYRVRVEKPAEHVARALENPEQYSTDAALRPLLADKVLPVIASVLGPGETAYHAMLKPIYDLFGIPQPAYVPRKGYTVLSRSQARVLHQYHIEAREILTESLDPSARYARLLPDSEREIFDRVSQDIQNALEPLQTYVRDIDPSLERTWQQTVQYTRHNVGRLRQKAMRAWLSQNGLAKQKIRALINLIYPRSRFQERVFPLPHFINLYGMEFIDQIWDAGNLDEFVHHILILEDHIGQ